VVRADERRELAHDQAAHRSSFCPCIMPENLARFVFSQSCSASSVSSPSGEDHLIDVVFERCDLPLRLDGDRSRQIALVTAVATSAMARTCVVSERPSGSRCP